MGRGRETDGLEAVSSLLADSDYESAHAQRTKTALKTVRLPVAVLEALEKEAEDEDSSLNSVVQTVLARHVEWGVHSMKLGMISISKAVMAAMLNAIPDEEVVKMGRSVVAGTWLDRTMFLFQDSSLENVLKVLELSSRHQGLFDLAIKREQTNWVLTLHHELGPKFSLLLEAGFDQVLRGVFRVRPTFRTGDTTLTVKFPTEGYEVSRSNSEEFRAIRPLSIPQPEEVAAQIRRFSQLAR